MMLIVKNRLDNLIFIAIKAVALILIALNLLSYFFNLPILVSSYFLILLNILLIFEYKYFKPFTILLFFILPYSLVAHFHFNDNNFPLHLGDHNDFDIEKLYHSVFKILTLFWASFSLCLPKLRKPIVLKDFLLFKNQPLVFYFLFSVLFFIFIFGRSGSTILESSGYGSADSNTSNLGGTAIFEYFIVIYPIAYIFSGKNRFRISLLITIAILYSVKALLFGGRIEFLQILLLLFVLNFDNANTSIFKILSFLLIPVFFLFFFGFLRTAPSSSISDVFTIIIDNINFAGYTFFGNQIDVFYSSTRLFGLVNLEIIPFQDRISIFFYNVIAVISPYSFLPVKANLALYLQDIYTAGGGGLLPIFFYVYLSYFGVLAIGVYMGLIFRKAIKFDCNGSQYLLVYILMIISTYPRWYAYSSNVIYKFCFYSVIIYFLINFTLSQIKNSRKINDNRS